MSDDALYSLRNNFFTGNYQAGINEAQSLDQDVDEEIKNVFINRCYIGLGNYQLVIDEIENNASPSLLAVKYLAQYFKSPAQGNSILEKLTSLNRTETVAVVLATVHYQLGNYEEGLKVVSATKSMEAEALMIHGLLALNRPDKAAEILAKMQKEDEDNPLVTLASAWVSICKGSDGIKDSYYLFQELIDKFSASPLLLNGVAVYNLKTDKQEEAKSSLQESIEKNPNDPDTLANMIVLTPYENKTPEQIAQLLSRRIRQLKSTAPQHKLVQNIDKFEESFDKLATRFAPSK